MTLTGSDKALTPARFGAARFGATRFGYAPTKIVVVGSDPLAEYTPDPSADEESITTTWAEEELTP